MKNIYQLINDFKQIVTPIENDYLNLGKELSKAIILMSEDAQIMSWEFVGREFSETENTLITEGASIYLKTDKQKRNFADGITQISNSVASLDNSIEILKAIKDPGGSMIAAIDALEKLKVELNNKYKPLTIN